MTPQEFFEKDRSTGSTGVGLIGIREEYGKAHLVTTEEHLNASNRTQGRTLFTLADPALATTANSRGTLAFSLSFNITLLHSSGPGDTLYAKIRERCTGRSTGYYQIDITSQEGELVIALESSVFRKGGALPFAAPL